MHIPKTAGNALQNILGQYSEDTIMVGSGKDGIDRFGVRSAFGTSKHSTLSDYLTALGSEEFWSKKRLTCVRNPWDRAISFYFSPHKGRVTWDRDEFIQGLDEIHPMTSFLSLPEDSPGMPAHANRDFVIRYENLNNDFAYLCDFLGIPRQMPVVRNKAKRLPYPEYYDAELIQIVGDHFREDVHTFGYEFNDQQANCG